VGAGVSERWEPAQAPTRDQRDQPGAIHEMPGLEESEGDGLHHPGYWSGVSGTPYRLSGGVRAMQVTARQENRAGAASDSRHSAWLENLADLATIPVEYLVNRHRLAPPELYHLAPRCQRHVLKSRPLRCRGGGKGCVRAIS
jgi:hypothetical protein